METFSNSSDFLEHFGVKGMQWGVRKERAPGVSNKTDKEASKDASEFARAKMFYGEGAGTRRKLIKASVDAKSAKDPNYKKAFDFHLAKQDMSTHAEKARSERKHTDTKKNVKQKTGYLARRFTGEMGNNAAFAAAGVAGLAYLSRPENRQKMTQRFNRAQDFVTRQINAQRLRRFLE